MKNFKSIGIRARVAYGILCLENCIATINIRNTQLDWLIESLWEYTFTRELDEWQKKMDEICPEVILDEYEDLNSLRYVDSNKAISLKSMYEELSEWMVAIIDEVILVGTSNLYASAGDYGANSLYHLENIVGIMQKEQIVLPDFSHVENYSFNDERGWGKTFNKSDLSIGND